MIRFVDLGTQINEWERLFAFWNTVNDQFEIFSWSQKWANKLDFQKSFQDDPAGYSTDDLERRYRMIPENWPDSVCGACESAVVKP